MKWLGLALCLWCAACSRTPAPSSDAGAVRRDSGDAGVRDASVQDANVRDAGARSVEDAAAHADGGARTATGDAADAGQRADAPQADTGSAAGSGSDGEGAAGMAGSTEPASPDEPIACTTRELQPGESGMSGESPASWLFMNAYPIGGRVDVHDAADSSESVLAALSMTLHAGAPITEYLDDGSGRACLRAVRFTVDVDLISEDSLLDEHWQALGSLDSSGALSLEIDAEVASLRGSLRERLGSSGAGDARIAIGFESPKTGAARVFGAMDAPANGALVFEWRALCDEHFPLYGESIWPEATRDCGRLDYFDSGGADGPETSEPSAPVFSCVRDALAANDAFGVGWRVTSGGKANYSGNLSRLDAQLSSDMRAPYLELLVSAGSNVARAQVRRCKTLEVQEPCSVATGGFETSGAPCFTCTEPGPWFRYCGNWR